MRILRGFRNTSPPSSGTCPSTSVSNYTAALQTWCEDVGDVFIDANGYIARRFALSSPEDYLIDFIHPNAGIGVRLYAEAVLKCDAAERMEC